MSRAGPSAAAHIEFLVTKDLVQSDRHPSIGVDGPVQGTDLLFDHHATGERVNLEAIPRDVPVPALIATTSLDTDAVISAAVVLLRSVEQHSVVDALRSVLYEAAHYSDYLVPSGLHPEVEREGLGLHCWIKDRGFAMSEVCSWRRGELQGDRDGRLRVRPSPATHSWVFGELTHALVEALRRGAVPCHFEYLERLSRMEAEVRQSARQTYGRVTVLALSTYVDPLALYRVVDSDIAVLRSGTPEGAHGYQLGVHPHAYDRVDLRRLYAVLNDRERQAGGTPGWGGRANAGGSPLVHGSRVPLEELIEILNAAAVEAEQPPQRR